MIRVADAPCGRIVVDVMPRHASPTVTSLTVPSCCVVPQRIVSASVSVKLSSRCVSLSRTQNQGNIIQIRFQLKLSGWVGRPRLASPLGKCYT
jgi:hypothetical protein